MRFPSSMLLSTWLTVTLSSVLRAGAALAGDDFESVGRSRDAQIIQLVKVASFDAYSTGTQAPTVDVNFHALSSLEKVQRDCIARQIVEESRFLKTSTYTNLVNALIAMNVEQGNPSPTEEGVLRFRIALLDNSSKSKPDGWFKESDNLERMLGRKPRQGDKHYLLSTGRVPGLGIYETVGLAGHFIIAPALDSGNHCKVLENRFLEDRAKEVLKRISDSH